MTDRPLLICFLGFPGSGKTYFSTRLAKELRAVTVNSDALRMSMFKSLDAIEQIRQSDRSRLYDDVFGAMDYAAKQVLLARHSVIYDAQQTKRRDRRNIEQVAQSVDALPILVWIKTTPEVALQRGQERTQSDDSHRYSADKMAMLIDRFYRVTDLPDEHENTIEINGEHAFEQQYESFTEQLDSIIKKPGPIAN